ncbi:delta-sterol C-methyltransferase [Phlebopus sp. FC_14]|nr:delta-sterol C-methyltransferase [Phlebopus sp. FC_14]
MSSPSTSKLEDHNDLSNEFYDGATRVLEGVWGKSFHNARFHPGESIKSAVSRHEIYLASQIPLRAGMRVLDVGCGIGNPTLNIAKFTDTNIVGVNNNAAQIQKANQLAKQAGMSDKVSFVVGDFMKLAEQFGENSFDAVFAIEATMHAPSLAGVYTEIRKVLKPGGVFGVYEYCMTDNWDPSNPEHKEFARIFEVGVGIPEMRSCSQVREAVAAAGLQLEYHDDLTQRPAAIPWYYPFQGKWSKTQAREDLMTVWKMSPLGQFTILSIIRMMELLRLAPKGTHEVVEHFKHAIAAYVKGGQTKLFTPQYLVIARKPQ